MIPVLVLSLALALDALSVSIVEGAALRGRSFALALKLALTFGGFQALLALLGHLFSSLLGSWFEQFDHWIAFTLLTVIGLHMLRGAFKEEAESRKTLSLLVLLLLALATSIDSWVAGVTLGAFSLPVLLSITSIGFVTFVLCFLGTLLGQRIKPAFEKVKVEAVGGILLVGIGVETLVEHTIFAI